MAVLGQSRDSGPSVTPLSHIGSIKKQMLWESKNKNKNENKNKKEKAKAKTKSKTKVNMKIKTNFKKENKKKIEN